MGKWRAWGLRWLATKLRAFVDRHDPQTMGTALSGATTIVGPPAFGQVRHLVKRVSGFRTTLYDGPSGAEAARRFLHVKTHRERGRLEYWYDDGSGPVLRDEYDGG